MNEVVKFPINTPVEVTLQFEAGKRVEGRYGGQVMYSLLDNRVMYVPPYVEQRFQELAIGAGEPLLLSKRQVKLQKMAQKRALVAATLIAASASEFFTQDVEDADLCGRNLDTGPHPPGTREAQEYVRDRKLEELRPKPAVPVEPDAAVKPWKNFGEMRQVFERMREQVGETRYLEELELAGVQNPGQFQSAS